MSAGPEAATLAARGIAKRFGETRALAGVDLDLGSGELHALLGANGAGKSTLLGVLAGAVAPDAGTLALDGRPYAPRSPLDARRAGVAMIHQELALAPHMTVAENVGLGAEPRCGPLVDRPALRARARTALAAVGRGELDLERRVGTLALADRQLVEIARALALDARVLILDEPTSSLGAADVAHLFARLRELAARGVAVLYVSHALAEVFDLCGRYTVLRDGASVAGGALADTTRAALVRAMAGRDVAELYPRTTAVPGEVVLRLEAAEGAGASLAVRRGEVLGIAGLVGAGRTELLRALFGLDAPQGVDALRGGRLRVLGLDGPCTPRERWRSGAGFVSEDRKGEGLALARDVAENLALPVLARISPRGLLRRRALDALAARWIERLGIRCVGPGQTVAHLSGGNQQKVAVARLLAAEVELFLLDEPTRGIDVAAKGELYRWIDALAHDQQKAVVLVSSDLGELLGVADRIAVMARGVLGPARPAAEYDEHELLLAATGTAP